MKVTSISWFALFILITFAVAASAGTVVLDALVILFLGYSLIRIRTGRNYDAIPGSSPPLAPFFHVVQRSWVSVKLGGVTAILVTTVALSPFSWEQFGLLISALVTFELIATTLLECAYRSRHLGNVAITILLVLFFWSLRSCSNAIARHLLNDETLAVGRSWTSLCEHWYYVLAIALGTLALLAALLRMRLERRIELMLPRLWLFK